ncbi:MAG: hypothetical protein KTR31_33150 [Myxococcales bacterium]|nr:hypothetical protein [Myxococcales bacterium]
MELTVLGPATSGSEPLLFERDLHRSTVHAIAVLPDGYSAVSCSEDGAVMRWSIETGEVLQALEGHDGPVLHLAARGRWLATAGADGTVRLWNVQGRLYTHLVLEHAQPARRVALSDRHVITVCGDHDVRVFDGADGGALHVLRGHTSPVQTVAASPDGRFAITASIDHAVWIWDLATGERLQPLYDAQGAVREVGAGGLYVASPNRSGIGHVDASPAHAVFGGADRLLTASDGLVEWDLETRSEIRRSDDLGWAVQGLATSPSGTFVATHTEVRGMAHDDWGTVVFRHPAPPSGVTALAAAGERLLVGAHDGTLQILDASAGAPTERHMSHALRATVAGSGQVAATIDHDNVVRLWGLEAGGCRATLDAHRAASVKPFAFSPDGALIATATARRGDEPAVAVYDVAAGELRHRLDHGQSDPTGVHSVLFAWDGVIVGPTGAGHIQWWALDGQRVHALQGHTQQVSRLALSGQLLVSEGFFAPQTGGDAVPQLQAWNLWDRKLLWTRPAHRADGERFAPLFGALTILPGDRLLTGTGEGAGQLAVYGIADGRIQTRWELPHEVRTTHVLAHGQLLAVTHDPAARRHELVWLDGDGTAARRWELPHEVRDCTVVEGRAIWVTDAELVVADLNTTDVLARAPLAGNGVASLAARADGTRIVVGGASGRVHLFAAS